MADAAENQIQPNPAHMPVASRKILMRTSEEPPVFINSAEFSAMGMDVFMDLGVVPVESFNAALKLFREDPTKPAPIDFHVSFRFGMSIQTALMMYQRLTQLIQTQSQLPQSVGEEALEKE